MGVSYLLLPIEERIINWLKSDDVSLASSLQQGRAPTLSELKSAIDQLEGYAAVVTKASSSIDIDVIAQRGCGVGWSTTIWAKKLHEDGSLPGNADPIDIHFHKGHPELAAMIGKSLADYCGPLVLIRDIDGAPLILTAETTNAEIDAWLNG